MKTGKNKKPTPDAQWGTTPDEWAEDQSAHGYEADPSDPEVVNQALRDFVSQVRYREESLDRRNQRNQRLREEKSRALIPFRKLLAKLVDMQVIVLDARSFEAGMGARRAEHPLEIYESASSPTWQPGESIYLDHPAQIEIAIPNPAERPKYGVVVIRCSTPHPEGQELHRKFETIDAAVMALAKFLSKNTVRVGRPPSS